jgi:hypothetical protein
MNTNRDTEPISVEDLHGMFEGRSPEPDTFREGVERRITERRRAAEEESEEPPRGMTFMRRAAAVLPLDPIGGGQIGSTALKFMYTILALPALVLASTLGSFLFSARAVKREMQTATPSVLEPPRRSVFQAMRSGRHMPLALNRDLLIGRRLMGVVDMGLLLALLLSFLTGGKTGLDVLTLVLVIAMASIVLLVRGLAQAGLLSRREVTRLALALLMNVFTGCFLWFSTVLAIPDGHSTLGVGWASGVVLVGIVACVFSGWGLRRGVLTASLVLLFALFFNPLAITKSTPSLLRNQLAGTELDPGSLQDWEEAAASFLALESIGAETPEMSSTTKKLVLAIDSEADVHPVVWTAAARMGLIDDEHWARLARVESEADELDDLLDPNSSINTTDYYAYRFHLLLATRDLSPEQRDHLATKAEAEWPRAEGHSPLSTAAMLVQVFELLGRNDLVESHRDAIDELLVSYWAAPGSTGIFSHAGGFTSNPSKFDTSFVDETWNAILLMSRVGVPEEIDPRWVRGYLQNESHAWPLFFEALPTHKLMPRAALLCLEEKIGLPQRSWFEVLLAERLLIATILVVALCLMAIALAPPRLEEMGSGARP